MRKNDSGDDIDPQRCRRYDSAMKYRLVAALLVSVAFTGVAQNGQWEFRSGPRFWGATIAGRYMFSPPTVEGVETSITGLLSSAYESVGYYRNPDGSFFRVPEDGTDEAAVGYNRFDLVWQVGIQQGVLPRHDVTADRAVAFLIYQGQFNHPFTEEERLFFASPRPETEGNLRGSVIGGLAYSVVTTDEITRARRGLSAELAIEWGPPFLHNTVLAVADYNRSTLSLRGYLPVFAADPVEGRNRFSAYLAGYGAIDWATGPDIPLAVRQSIGGRAPRSAPGGSVRGYGGGRFDSTVKAIGNVEVRLHLPAIVVPEVIPGLVLYTDAGYYLDTERVSPVEEENSGMLLSSGAGFFLDLFASAELVFYTNYLWTKGDVSAKRWVPFSLGFGFHF